MQEILEFVEHNWIKKASPFQIIASGGVSQGHLEIRQSCYVVSTILDAGVHKTKPGRNINMEYMLYTPKVIFTYRT